MMTDREISQAYDRYTDLLLEQYHPDPEEEDEDECDDFDEYERYHCMGAGGWR